MFQNRRLNNHINRIHERALRSVYQDHNLTFEQLPSKDGSFKIHDLNLERLFIEIFKVKAKLAPEIMHEIFDIIESPYPLRNELKFKSRNIRTVRYGIGTATFVGSKIWSYMPSELKESASLNEFTSKLKTWKPENYPRKLCKIYLHRMGYLQVTNQYMLIDTIIYASLFVCLLALLGVFFCLFLFLFSLSISSLPFLLTPSVKLTSISLTSLIKAVFVV